MGHYTIILFCGYTLLILQILKFSTCILDGTFKTIRIILVPKVRVD